MRSGGQDPLVSGILTLQRSARQGWVQEGTCMSLRIRLRIDAKTLAAVES